MPIDRATEPPLPDFNDCSDSLPSEPLESEDAAAVQIYELRREAQHSCVVVKERLNQVIARQWWIVSQLLGQQAFTQDLKELLERAELVELDAFDRLGVVENHLAGTLQVEAPGGVELSNPPDVAGVEQAVVNTNDTANQNLWAIFGLVVGFGLLFWFFRLVRP